ncbi:MAG: glycolate oxidase subunit GlcE, partial [Pseudomonadota bacterium]
LLDGRGQVLSFGGRVMKNVAGYDVSRALAGSLGVLGVILEVSLKVLPRPPVETTLVFEFDEATALARACAWGARPLPISATAWHDGCLRLRLSGAPAAVGAARRVLGGEAISTPADASYWRQLREQQLPFFAGATALWRVAVPPTAPPLEFGDATLIEWGGAQRWVRTAAPAERVRERVARLGGHATLFRAQDRSSGAFTPLAPALLAIHRRLKAEFDPAGVLNPGRLYAEF